MSNNSTHNSTHIDSKVSTENNPSRRGLGRLWFAILFSILFLVVSVNTAFINVVADIFFVSYRYSTLMIQVLVWNFVIAIITAPVFYLRIITIRLRMTWILALIIPFVWSVLLVRCLVFQAGYTASGKLDRQGLKNLKWVNYSLYVIGVLSVTYLLADYF
ncbi:hypothetical protein MNBD_GAMMA12-1576 [hydrothermal vent metagenome]|uniref:Uncharacterized protein n=1 Tax=hydrothermal vent metagenome TaxID=652676 RepID=A0A3B0Y4R4_9ZZZZ